MDPEWAPDLEDVVAVACHAQNLLRARDIRITAVT